VFERASARVESGKRPEGHATLSAAAETLTKTSLGVPPLGGSLVGLCSEMNGRYDDERSPIRCIRPTPGSPCRNAPRTPMSARPWLATNRCPRVGRAPLRVRRCAPGGLGPTGASPDPAALRTNRVPLCPLYLSDWCSGGCAYCGFASDRRHRRTDSRPTRSAPS